MSTPGDAFGEIALLRSIPRTASVTAETDSILLVLDRADFIMAVTGNPVAAEGVDRLVQARLEDRD
jgi:CRP-like cAMP-binding protein